MGEQIDGKILMRPIYQTMEKELSSICKRCEGEFSMAVMAQVGHGCKLQRQIKLLYPFP